VFHGVGKILCNKRDDNAMVTSNTSVPHLDEFRRLPTKSNPDDVLEHTDTSPTRFLGFLFSNYPTFFTDIEDLAKASECLSDCNYMASEFEMMSLRPTATNIAARGLMYHNRHPSKLTFKALYKETNQRRATSENMALIKHVFKEEMFYGLHEGTSVVSSEIVPYLSKIASSMSFGRSPLTVAQSQFFSGLCDYEDALNNTGVKGQVLERKGMKQESKKSSKISKKARDLAKRLKVETKKRSENEARAEMEKLLEEDDVEEVSWDF